MEWIDELIDLDGHEGWAAGFATFQHWNSPWAAMLDATRFRSEVDRLQAAGVSTIATCHGPTIPAGHVAAAFDLMRAVPDVGAPPQPGQPVLDEIIDSILAAGPPPAGA
jgi:hypothetical protein